jgi:cleavage and polyadenylation specificity factor subunit 1
LVCASLCWPRMSCFAGAVAKNCVFCQKAKVHRHVALEAVHIPVPHRRFEHIHVDLVGPLPVSGGYNYLFTVLDRTSRWPEAIPLSGITAGDCADALFRGWIQRFVRHHKQL